MGLVERVSVLLAVSLTCMGVGVRLSLTLKGRCMFSLKEIVVMIILWAVFITTVQYFASQIIVDAYMEALYG